MMTFPTPNPVRPRDPIGRERHVPQAGRSPSMNLTLSLAPLASLIAGLLILVVPRLLNYIVAVYLIVVGILGIIALSS